ncbi:Uncharacterized protein APZ42_007771, partial [Daphnia magna]
VICFPSPVLIGVFTCVAFVERFLEANLSIQAVLLSSRFQDGIRSRCHSTGVAGSTEATDMVTVFDFASASILSWTLGSSTSGVESGNFVLSSFSHDGPFYHIGVYQRYGWRSPRGEIRRILDSWTVPPPIWARKFLNSFDLVPDEWFPPVGVSSDPAKCH